MSIGRENGVGDPNMRHVPDMDADAAAELLAMRANRAENDAATEAARLAHLNDASAEHKIVRPEDFPERGAA